MNEYGGEERRKDYVGLAVQIERWNIFMVNTENYRKELCGKINNLNNQIDDLSELINKIEKERLEEEKSRLREPCKKEKDLSRLWWAVGSIIAWILIITGLMVRK